MFGEKNNKPYAPENGTTINENKRYNINYWEGSVLMYMYDYYYSRVSLSNTESNVIEIVIDNYSSNTH
jgi:hypothetical protein